MDARRFDRLTALFGRAVGRRSFVGAGLAALGTVGAPAADGASKRKKKKLPQKPLACGECGVCGSCDEAGACVECSAPCETASMCAAANRSKAAKGLVADLAKRGFSQSAGSEAAILRIDGDTRRVLVVPFAHATNAALQAHLVFATSGEVAQPLALALMSSDEIVRSLLYVDTKKSKVKQRTSAAAAAAANRAAPPRTIQGCDHCRSTCSAASNLTSIGLGVAAGIGIGALCVTAGVGTAGAAAVACGAFFGMNAGFATWLGGEAVCANSCDDKCCDGRRICNGGVCADPGQCCPGEIDCGGGVCIDDGMCCPGQVTCGAAWCCDAGHPCCRPDARTCCYPDFPVCGFDGFCYTTTASSARAGVARKRERAHGRD